MFTMTMLIENEFAERKVGTKSQVSELLDVQGHMSGELDEMSVAVATHDAEISQLKARMQQLMSEEPGGASTGLKAKNVKGPSHWTY